MAPALFSDELSQLTIKTELLLPVTWMTALNLKHWRRAMEWLS